MRTRISKASPLSPRSLNAKELADAVTVITGELEPQFAEAFLLALRNYVPDSVLAQVTQWYRSGELPRRVADLRALLGTLTFDGDTLRSLQWEAYQAGGQTTAAAMRNAGFKLDFDAKNDLAIAAAQEFGARLVVAQQTVRDALQTIIVNAYTNGVSVDDLAAQVYRSVDLTPRHAVAVANYERKLIADGVPLPIVQQRVGEYTDRLKNWRAWNIARTETMNAAALGRQNHWRTAEMLGYLDSQTTQRMWVTRFDELTCPICAVLGKPPYNKVPLGGDYVHPVTGQRFARPGAHPQCRCSETLIYTPGWRFFAQDQAFTGYADSAQRWFDQNPNVVLVKGEKSGHAFRGNQHTGGIPGQGGRSAAPPAVRLPRGWKLSDLEVSTKGGETKGMIRLTDSNQRHVGHVTMQQRRHGNLTEVWIDMIEVNEEHRGEDYADALMDKVYATLGEWSGGKHIVVHNNLLAEGRKWLKSYLAERPNLIPYTSVEDSHTRFDGFDQPTLGYRVLKGEAEGHAFRGNQYTGGKPGPGKAAKRKRVRRKVEGAKDERKGRAVVPVTAPDAPAKSTLVPSKELKPGDSILTSFNRLERTYHRIKEIKETDRGRFAIVEGDATAGSNEEKLDEYEVLKPPDTGAERKQLTEKVTTSIYEAGGTDWDGRVIDPKDYDPDRSTKRSIVGRISASLYRQLKSNPELASWCEKQRAHYFDGITAEQRKLYMESMLGINDRLDANVPSYSLPKGREGERLAVLISGVRAYVDAWANSAADSSPSSIALQRTVAEEFGLQGTLKSIKDYSDSGSSSGETAWDKATERLGEEGPFLRAFAHSVYDVTQSQLAAAGVKELHLYRGMIVDPKKVPLPNGGPKPLAYHRADLGLGTPQYALVYSEPGSNDVVDYRLSPLSSWSADAGIARGFGWPGHLDKGVGVVMEAVVPAERVWSLAASTGPGCLSEREVLVLSGPMESRVAEYPAPTGEDMRNEAALVRRVGAFGMKVSDLTDLNHGYSPEYDGMDSVKASKLKPGDVIGGLGSVGKVLAVKKTKYATHTFVDVVTEGRRDVLRFGVDENVALSVDYKEESGWNDFEAIDTSVSKSDLPVVWGDDELRNQDWIKWRTDDVSDTGGKIVPKIRSVEKGEHEGHPFRGNQHTGGIPGGGSADVRRRGAVNKPVTPGPVLRAMGPKLMKPADIQAGDYILDPSKMDAPIAQDSTHPNGVVNVITRVGDKYVMQYEDLISGEQKVFALDPGISYFVEPIESLSVVNRKKALERLLLSDAELAKSPEAAVETKRQINERLSNRIISELETNPDLRKWAERSGEVMKETLLRVPNPSNYEVQRATLASNPERSVKRMVRRTIDTWATSSGDSDYEAIALQRAVSEVFGLPDQYLASLKEYSDQKSGSDTASDDSTWEISTKYLNDYRPFLHSFAKAVYEETQQRLADSGIEELDLYRGMSFQFNRMPGPGRQVSTPMAVLGREGKGWKGVFPAVQVTTGAEVALATNPVSSWSTDYSVARSFSKAHRFGVATVLSATVPAERVWSLASSTGPGCLGEREVVVIAGPANVRVVQSTADEDYRRTKAAYTEELSESQAKTLLGRGKVAERPVNLTQVKSGAHTVLARELRPGDHLEGLGKYGRVVEARPEIDNMVQIKMSEGLGFLYLPGDAHVPLDVNYTKRSGWKDFKAISTVEKSDTMILNGDEEIENADWIKWRTNDVSADGTVIVPKIRRLRKGEHEGHPFRGNQHTGGIPGVGRASSKGRARLRSEWKRRETVLPIEYHASSKRVKEAIGAAVDSPARPTPKAVKQAREYAKAQLQALPCYKDLIIHMDEMHPEATKAITDQLVAFGKEYPHAAAKIKALGGRQMEIGTGAVTSLEENFNGDLGLFLMFNTAMMGHRIYAANNILMEHDRISKGNVTDSVASVAQHELGHVMTYSKFIDDLERTNTSIDEWIGTHGQTAFHNLVWMDTVRATGNAEDVLLVRAGDISGYATASPAEGLAEAWVAWLQGNDKLDAVVRPPEVPAVYQGLIDELVKHERSNH